MLPKGGIKIEDIRRQQLEFPDLTALIGVCGKNDENLEFLEKQLGVHVLRRGNLLSVEGEDEFAVRCTTGLLRQMLEISLKGHRMMLQDLRYAVDVLKKHGTVDLAELYSELVCLTVRGKPIRPRTPRQREYIKSMTENTIIFSIGPAGTGKTYLAVCEAVNQLKNGMVNRIILVRPAVEAGESLGFLPGDLREKVEPYLRPLYDAFFELLSPEKFARYAEKNIIEIAPLAYMRGRTLNDSFIILDEAQNTTPEQMKMFLTRLGFGSRAIITGDLTQIDLPKGRKSGLEIVQEILKGINGISFVYLQNEDVVRHEIVQKVVAAYDRYEASRH